MTRAYHPRSSWILAGVTATLPSEAALAPVASRVQEWASPRVRPGRRFLPGAERALDPVLRNLAARLPGAVKGVSVIAEMPGPTGLPDLLAIPMTPRLAARLELQCPPLLAWSDARLAAACSPRHPLSAPTLARRVDGDIRAVTRRLSRLSACGALVKAKSGYFLRTPELEPVGRLYALEAKVDDWSGGFGQALRYGTWADASAVVVHQLPRDSSRAVQLATTLGLGLAHETRWLVRPRLRRLSLAHRLWASEHVVAAMAGAAPIAAIARG
jgi:hypothetical protein